MRADDRSTRAEWADRVEFLAKQILAIRGISHSNPHAFVEDKSELAAAMMAVARAMRVDPAAPVGAKSASDAISTGTRMIGRARREVAVISRCRRP